MAFFFGEDKVSTIKIWGSPLPPAFKQNQCQDLIYTSNGDVDRGNFRPLCRTVTFGSVELCSTWKSQNRKCGVKI